ncbi:MAG: ferredoxin family protein [Promethearchaeota archaeon]|nr:MAG: ferredoxin family protein [Candidatus Lokiarchaeota archaeon]
MLDSKRAPILPPPRPQKKYQVVINSEQCDGCKICIEFCPKELLKESEEANSRMLHYVEIVNSEDCLGCKQCERLCPTTSIFIYEIDLQEGEINEP